MKLNFTHRGKPLVLEDGKLHFNNGEVVLDLTDMSRFFQVGRVANDAWEFYRKTGDGDALAFSVPVGNFMSRWILDQAHRLSIHGDIAHLEEPRMKQFEAENAVTPHKQSLLTLGAVLTNQNGQPVKTFKLTELTGGDNASASAAATSLMDWWGVKGEKDALEILEKLSTAEVHTERANRLFADEIAMRLTSVDFIGELRKKEDARIHYYATTCEILLNLPYPHAFTKRDISTITNFAAWDLGRVVYVARTSVFAELLQEEQAWPYLEQAGKLAFDTYSGWREYMAAYLLGRTLGYGGDPDAPQGYPLRRGINYLMRAKSSPLKENPWELLKG